LLESELFGHERGAFTGAYQNRIGLFEQANGGTLFLDEIAELALPLQSKFLRVLDEKRLRRIGASGYVDVDVRIIAAANVDLAMAVAEGHFREDLFYRLCVVVLDIPPLRDRLEDIDLLTRHFARTIAEHHGVPVPKVTPQLLEVVRTHNWPGNVRELRNAIERVLILSPAGTLNPNLLPIPATPVPTSATRPEPHPQTLRTIMKGAVHAALRRHGGNKSAAARELDISRARLQRLLESCCSHG
jgi:transcriptional regulator with PAS, ATPase and Fis domain